MEGVSIAESVLGGAVGGLLAALVALAGSVITARWRIAEENITKERAKWRDAVRHLIENAVTTADDVELERVWAALALRMNPNPSDGRDDRELVALVRSLRHVRYDARSQRKDRIVALAAHILKHDWERAKWEADHHWFWQDAPKQTRYSGPATWEMRSSDSPAD